MKLNEIISERRKSLGLKAKYIADKIEYRGKTGIRPATISDFENGKHPLNSHILEQLLQILKLTICEIPGEEKENENCG